MKIRYPITSKFNAIEDFRNSHHLGLDFAMKDGTELRSIKDGVISKIVNQPEGLGKAVYVDWGNGKTAIYGHMKEIKVRVGEKVATGDLLGLSGNTGNVVGENGGYHLHFAIKENGKFVDPEPYAHLIQEMNHKVLEAKTQLVTSPDIVGPALERFINTLSELKMQLVTFIHSNIYEIIQHVSMFFS